MRINRFLAEAGLGSRRKVEQLVLEGRVKVNNKIVTDLATNIDSSKDNVRVDNTQIQIEKKVYIALNKPKGYVTTLKDERGRMTVIDLVDVKVRVYPVGRLDMNSRGLILLTNDGELAVKLLHPRHKIEKKYRVTLDNKLSPKAIRAFEKGIILDGKRTARANLRQLKTKQGFICEVILKEGRKRQIRRMFDILGYKVLDLKRVQIANIKLGSLKEGVWRYLSNIEYKALISFLDK